MIESFVQNNNLSKYRIQQFNQAYYHQLVDSFDDLFTWSKQLREKLKKELSFSTLEVVNQLTSQDKSTTKVVFKLKSTGRLIETVLMQHSDKRNTLCVSCMVGCPVNCTFCATGKMGFMGNLSAQEIVDQVMHFARILHKKDQKVSNVVYMGMGEPMLNLKEVMASMNILTDPEKLALSKRRITISTSGYVPQLRQLIASGYKGRLAISFHAPEQKLREQLMPVAKLYPLDDLLKVLDEFVQLSNKRITYEYILIKKVTDQPKQAEQLVKLFKNRLAHFNLIPYNPIKGEKYERSDKKSIHRFDQILTQAGIPSSVRVTMGDDIAAACGQLAVAQ